MRTPCKNNNKIAHTKSRKLLSLGIICTSFRRKYGIIHDSCPWRPCVTSQSSYDRRLSNCYDDGYNILVISTCEPLASDIVRLSIFNIINQPAYMGKSNNWQAMDHLGFYNDSTSVRSLFIQRTTCLLNGYIHINYRLTTAYIAVTYK